MKTYSLITAFAALMSLLLPTASAAEIGHVTISSYDQASQLQAVVGSAFFRVDNRFLVSADENQRRDLAGVGLRFEPVLDGADPASLHIVYPDHDDLDGSRSLRRYGLSQDIGDGAILISLRGLTAAAMYEESGERAVPLADHTIRIVYQAPIQVTSLPMLDYHSDTLVSRVSRDSVFAFDQRLEDFYTRYTWSDSIDRARDWMVQKFQDWGYTDVTTPSFEWGGGTHYNVRAVKPGYAEPDKLILIGAHYDATSTNPTVFAPGADDNGTGTALVLELARILADIPLRKTVIFMPFSVEEQGLIGSRDAAADLVAENADLEVMFNHDMIGYTADSYWDLKMIAGSNDVYRQIYAATATRLTGIIPLLTGVTSNSDHFPFHQQGFPICYGHEADFNTPHYHSPTDQTIYLNFDYMTEVVKTALVSLAIVADGTYPVTADRIIDAGDGQSLEVNWTPCIDDVTYTVYWGESSGVYDDSLVVSPGVCGATLEGLTDGVEYFVKVVGEAPNGHRSLYAVEGSLTPQAIPRRPQGFTATAEILQIDLSWRANPEADISHYNLYRRFGDRGVFALYGENLTDTTFSDNQVASQMGYTYRVVAVDYDGNESPTSNEVYLYPASFDGGPVVVDAWASEQTYWPDQAGQQAYLDSVFGDLAYALVRRDSTYDTLASGDVGRFSSLYWIDDDINLKTADISNDVLQWYAGQQTNMFISGFRTILRWTDPPIEAGHVLKEEFRIDDYEYWGQGDFEGAIGQNGWPSIQVDPDRGPDLWTSIPVLTPGPGATIILTYDSFYDAQYEGLPCGLAYDGPNGKRVIVGFPLWFLTVESTRDLIAAVSAYFGSDGQTFDRGDLDHSGTVDVTDISLLISYIFLGLDLGDAVAEADVDSYPGIDIGDITYLVNFLLAGGPAPVPAQP
ncbi:MAG: M28 family peptidase [candidate division Zixibacteria bacterium]|nr:M28 family peptidase [candidate division Zixibacteria bacterium]